MTSHPSARCSAYGRSPNDEIFLTAGLMLLARRAGNRVVCVTATLGEHGTDQPEEWRPQRLGELRAREHRASLHVLDVEAPIVLGYLDGTCDRVDVATAAARLADVIDDVRPDAVVTFGPDGMTGHPDHVAVSGRRTPSPSAPTAPVYCTPR